MSFSGEVKEELTRQQSPGRHCQIAEIAAILCMSGSVEEQEPSGYRIRVVTENADVAARFTALTRRAFHITPDDEITASPARRASEARCLTIQNPEDARRVLSAVKLLDSEGRPTLDLTLANHLVVRQSCCRRAFIRGAFLASGSMSDPSKSYHFEIVCSNEAAARQLEDIIRTFHVPVRTIRRKSRFVVYIKEGEGIVDILGLMEARVALMNMENIRIWKEMRNSVNRQVNCEAANIGKTVSAAMKQIEDITYIKNHIGFSRLSDALAETARLRVEYPDATLKELGGMFEPPVGKSGVSHRLKKLSEIAENCREQ